jgi:hypothetical protein
VRTASKYNMKPCIVFNCSPRKCITQRELNHDEGLALNDILSGYYYSTGLVSYLWLICSQCRTWVKLLAIIAIQAYVYSILDRNSINIAPIIAKLTHDHHTYLPTWQHPQDYHAHCELERFDEFLLRMLERKGSSCSLVFSLKYIL